MDGMGYRVGYLHQTTSMSIIDMNQRTGLRPTRNLPYEMRMRKAEKQR